MDENELKPKNRIWELDFLKGIALLFMVWDHFVYDLNGFFGYDTSGFGFFKESIGIISAVLFMVLCGVSLTLGKHNLKRGAIVFLLGMALTLFTFIFDKITNSDSLILFGILHFLGFAMIIGHFLKKLSLPLLSILCAVCFGLGFYFESLTVSQPLLFPFGLTTGFFYSSDYFPLFPNLAYVILGIIIGKTAYKNKKSLFKFKPKKSLICFLGKHTLILYFAHQPVVFALIYIFTKILK